MQLNAAQLVPALKAMENARLAFMIWGTPGIGKSAVVNQYAEATGKRLVDIRLSQFDSVDLRGFPSVSDGWAQWNAPRILPFKGNPDFHPKNPVVLFLDELLQAPPAVQAVAFQLVLDRRVGEHELMDNVFVVAASNRDTDRAGANRMLTALANRFVHVEMVPNLDAWVDWALDHDIDSKLIAFLRFRPELMSTFITSKGAVTSEKVFASLRSWEFVDRIVKQKLSLDLEVSLCAGAVGEGPAAELKAFWDTWASMPSIDNAIMNPDTAELPSVKRPDVMFAVTTALGERAEQGTFGNILKYCDRLPPEYAVRVMRDATRRNVALGLHTAFLRAVTKYSNYWKA